MNQTEHLPLETLRSARQSVRAAGQLPDDACPDPAATAWPGFLEWCSLGGRPVSFASLAAYTTVLVDGDPDADVLALLDDALEAGVL